MPIKSSCCSRPSDAAAWLESNTGTISDALRTIGAVKKYSVEPSDVSDDGPEATKTNSLIDDLATIQQCLDRKAKQMAPCVGGGNVHVRQLSGLWTTVVSEEESENPTPEMYNDVARFLSLHGFETEIRTGEGLEPIDAAHIIAQAMRKSNRPPDGLPPGVKKAVFKVPESGPCVFHGVHLYYHVPLGMGGYSNAWHGSLYLQQVTPATLGFRSRQHHLLRNMSSSGLTEAAGEMWAVTCEIQWPTVIAANKYGPLVAERFETNHSRDVFFEYSHTFGTLQTVKIQAKSPYTSADIRIMVERSVRMAQEHTAREEPLTLAKVQFTPPVTIANASAVLVRSDYRLWVPTHFPDGGEVYVIDATNREDMYQLRAAMVLRPRPIIIHSSTSDTKDLEDYLENTSPTQKCFVTTLSFDTLEDQSRSPGEYYKLSTGYKILGEDAATSIIAKETTENNKSFLAAGMTQLSGDYKNLHRAEISKVCSQLFPDKYDVMIMYRDTGTKCPNPGDHPELDSDQDSISVIAEYVSKINDLKVVLCGNANHISEWPSIGKYFEKVPVHHKRLKRDVEAWFLKVAYEEGYYKMVIGFRSSALDLFTFLGIPTVSMSLRRYVGEQRHRKIANSHLFRRWHVQYEMPRHSTTAYFPDIRQKGVSSEMGSPWWEFDKTRTPPDDEKKKGQCASPGSLTVFDRHVLIVGIHNAVLQELPSEEGKAPPILSILPEINPEDARVFDNASCRPCYPEGADSDIFEMKREAEDELFSLRERTLEKRMEPQAIFDNDFRKMKEDWVKIFEKIKDRNDADNETECEISDQDGYVIV